MRPALPLARASTARRYSGWHTTCSLRVAKLFAEGSPEQKQIDETMAMFRRSFPSRDELFFRGLTSAGVPYDVKCGWITGRTTVKMVDLNAFPSHRTEFR